MELQVEEVSQVHSNSLLGFDKSADNSNIDVLRSSSDYIDRTSSVDSEYDEPQRPVSKITKEKPGRVERFLPVVADAIIFVI